MSTFITRAIPLRIQPLTKQDELVVLLTASHGKVRAMIRGGQKIVSKLSNRLHILQEVDVMIANGRSMAIVAGVVTRYKLNNLQNDLDRRILALTLLDVINTIAPEREIDLAIYDFTLFWLHVLEDKDIKVDAPFCALVLWRLLKLIGLSPTFALSTSLRTSAGKPDNQQSVTGFGKLNKNNQYILKNILEKTTEIEVLEFLLSLEKTASLLAARIALYRLQHLLECEVRGLRVLARL